MALVIEELKQVPAGGMYVSPERICLTADGRLTDQDDPEAVRLLVAKGCEIPASEAAQYGLIAEDVSSDAGTEPAPDGGTDAADEAPADEAPVETKKRK